MIWRIGWWHGIATTPSVTNSNLINSDSIWFWSIPQTWKIKRKSNHTKLGRETSFLIEWEIVDESDEKYVVQQKMLHIYYITSRVQKYRNTQVIVVEFVSLMIFNLPFQTFADSCVDFLLCKVISHRLFFQKKSRKKNVIITFWPIICWEQIFHSIFQIRLSQSM